MEDTTPADIVTAAGAVAVPVKSAFQARYVLLLKVRGWCSLGRTSGRGRLDHGGSMVMSNNKYSDEDRARILTRPRARQSRPPKRRSMRRELRIEPQQSSREPSAGGARPLSKSARMAAERAKSEPLSGMGSLAIECAARRSGRSKRSCLVLDVLAEVIAEVRGEFEAKDRRAAGPMRPTTSRAISSSCRRCR